MSTNESLYHNGLRHPDSVHIYREMGSGEYYICRKGRHRRIPEVVAKSLARLLNAIEQ